MILISKGIHSHPPPPPNRVPVTIRDRLQELIRQANDNTMDVTPTCIITGKFYQKNKTIILKCKYLIIFIIRKSY